MNFELFTFLPFSEKSLKKFDLNAKDKREFVALINDSLFKKCAKSNKDKFEALDLRDKVLKVIRYELNTQINSCLNANLMNPVCNKAEFELNKAQSNMLVGTCEDMCPEKERYNREILNLLHTFELKQNLDVNFDNDDDDEQENDPIPGGNQRFLIKEYSRSSADQDLPLPNELRSLNVLYQTMLYLINDIIPKINASNDDGDFSICSWYDFIWNRTRAIRKDIIIQRLLLNGGPSSSETGENSSQSDDVNAIYIIEQCARFHIMCAYRLCDQSPDIFDFKINEENLKNCFQSLRQYYEQSSSSSGGGGGAMASQLRPSPYEAEFRAYIILLNLNESNILSEIQRWPKGVRHSAQVRFALNVYFAYNARNYMKFFRLVNSDACEYLQACILHRYFHEMRYTALRCIFSAYRESKEKVYPYNKLKELLCFDSDEQIELYCRQYEFDITDENNIIMTSARLPSPNTDLLRLMKSRMLIDEKFLKKLDSLNISEEQCLSKVIFGESERNKYRPNDESIFSLHSDNPHQLHSSFDSEGNYISNEIEQFLTKAKQIFTNIKALSLPASTLGKSNNTQSVPMFNVKNDTSHGQPATLFGKTAAAQQAPTVLFGKTVQEQTQKQSIFGKTASSQQQPTSLFGKTSTIQPASLFGKTTTAAQPTPTSLFGKPANENTLFGKTGALAQQAPTPLFGKPVQEQTQQPSLFGKPAMVQQQPIPFFGKTVADQAHNPFSSITSQAKPSGVIMEPKGPMIEPSKIPPPSQPIVPPQVKIDSHAENIFQSLYLEIVKLTANEYLLTQRQIPNEIAEHLVNVTVEDELRSIARDTLRMMNQSSEQIFDSLLGEILNETAYGILGRMKDTERNIYENIVCYVFQSEFELILKQIANELNNEIVLDKLAEAVYSYWNEYDQPEQQPHPDDHDLCSGSMFDNDLRSYLHQCVFECTRLNLNVNRELYYEIKQVISFNQLTFMFRKWRLKLSRKLLNKAYKQAASSSSSTVTSPILKAAIKSSHSNELNCFNILHLYGDYLQKNLNKFHRLASIILPKSTTDTSYSLNFVIHSQEFLQHLSRNVSVNHKHLMYNILYENYFDLIHNRYENVMLELPNVQTHSELYVKIVFAHHDEHGRMIRLGSSLSMTDWLLSKYFGATDQPATIVENFSLNNLNENTYGVKYILNVCNLSMNQQEYEQKLNDRTYYGANSILITLASLRSYNNQLDEYITTYRSMFANLLRLISPSSIGYVHVMFISLLPTEKLTRHVIESMLKESVTSIQFSDCYCLVNENERNLIDANSSVLQTYETFLRRVCHDNRLKSNYQQIRSIVYNPGTLSDIFYATVMKYFEFVSVNHQNGTLQMKFANVVDEYNVRLSKLIDLLTADYLGKIAWPMAELVDEFYTRSDEAKWTLKYWNTHECFDQVIRKQFYDIMSLDSCLNGDGHEMDDDDELVEFGAIEKLLLNYLMRMFERKKLPNQMMNFYKMVSQLRSSMKVAIDNMRKFTICKKNLFKTAPPEPDYQDMYICRKNINWSMLIMPIVNYLLTNSTFTYRNVKNIFIDQFYIYYDQPKVCSFDWVNNQPSSADRTTTGSTLMDKYSSKTKASSTSVLNKRRLPTCEPVSGLANTNTVDKVRKVTENGNESTEITKANRDKNLERLSNKLQKFIDLLHHEKENNTELENRLNAAAHDEQQQQSEAFGFKTTNGFSMRKSDILSEQASCSNSNVPNGTFDDTFDAFFNKLKEEKLKNEQFNEKLNKLSKIN